MENTQEDRNSLVLSDTIQNLGERLSEDIIPIELRLIEIPKKDIDETWYLDKIEELKPYREVLQRIEKGGVFYDSDCGTPPNFQEINNEIISCVDGRDKGSSGYRSCLGLVVIGKSIHNNGNISFITHQIPISRNEIKKRDSGDFGIVLDNSLKEIRNNSEEGSVDAVVFGGSASDVIRYQKKLDEISSMVIERLGFNPRVLIGPGGNSEKKIAPWTDVYLDTRNRLIYMVRLKI